MINLTASAEKELKEMVQEAENKNSMVRIFVRGFG